MTWGQRLWRAATAALAFPAVSLVARVLLPWPSFFDLAGERLLDALPGATFGLLLDRRQHAGKPLLLAGLFVLSVFIFGAVAASWEQFLKRRGGWRATAATASLALGLWLACGWAIGALALPASERLPVLAAALPGFLAFGGAFLIALPPYGLDHMAASPGRRRLVLGLGSVLAVTNFGALWRLVAGMLETPSAAQAPAAGLSSEPWTPSPFATAEATPTAVAAEAAATPGSSAPPLSTTPSGAAPSASAEPSGPPSLAASVPTPAPSKPAASATGLVLPRGMTPEITPNQDFYLVSKNFVDPQVALDAWSLEVSGLVSTPLRLSYAQLRALPVVQRYTTLTCISNVVGGPLAGNALWIGVSLATVLRAAGVRPEAKYVGFTAVDGYVESYPLEKALAPSTLLAYAMNGQPLPPRHGFPLRVISSGRYGMKNPKWLTKIELLPAPVQGHWERQGWDQEAVVQTLSRIDVPKVGQPVLLGSPALGGIAFAGERGISKVEVSVDAGRTWETALLAPAIAPSTWNLWVYPFGGARRASYDVKVRATDGTGTLQIETRRPSFPAGAGGYDEIEVTVT